MTDTRREFDFPIEIKEDEVSSLLGYVHRPIPERVREVLAEVNEEAHPLVRPACAIRRADARLLAGSVFLKELDDVVLCLVTIGDGVEKAMAAYSDAGEMGKALIMNVFGSAAAEATAEAANVFIRREVAARGLRCSRRFSPGYSGWDVSDQSWILPALDGRALGVTLTQGCMMVPRKSITFAVSVGDNPIDMRDDNACDGCELINCQYRRETVVTEENGKKCTTFTGPESNYCPLDRWS